MSIFNFVFFLLMLAGAVLLIMLMHGFYKIAIAITHGFDVEE